MIPGDSIPDYMHISLKGKRALYKERVDDARNAEQTNWGTPIYIAVSVGRRTSWIWKPLRSGRFAYRFTPFDTSKTGVTIDSERCTTTWWTSSSSVASLDKPGIYRRERHAHVSLSPSHLLPTRAAADAWGQERQGKAALDYAEKMIPPTTCLYDWQNGAVQMAEAYYQLGETAKGRTRWWKPLLTRL